MSTNENFEEGKLPQGLNALTILTIVGCVIGLLSSIWGYIKADQNVIDIQTQLNNPGLSDFAKKFINQDVLDSARVMAANKLPIVILSVISIILCFMGALQMRQRKMNGYYMWLTGEILPFISTAILIGPATIVKGVGPLIAIGITVLFILLYTMQRKYLTNNNNAV